MEDYNIFSVSSVYQYISVRVAAVCRLSDRPTAGGSAWNVPIQCMRDPGHPASRDCGSRSICIDRYAGGYGFTVYYYVHVIFIRGIITL